ncbi:RNA polymerase C-22 sterol desaturase [Pleosporales sp. CAS-2024a]
MFSSVPERRTLVSETNTDSTPLDLAMFESLIFYTNAVVKELVRYRPPRILVPYEKMKAFLITPDYEVPKGAIISRTFAYVPLTLAQ